MPALTLAQRSTLTLTVTLASQSSLVLLGYSATSPDKGLSRRTSRHAGRYEVSASLNRFPCLR